MGNLNSWRDVIKPHNDVAQGRYKNAEFAADLAQVARGEGSPEYQDPVEFFSRTYVTEGIKGLLIQGLKRILDMDGDPVVQLKTAFGGGKTHSMLALYHLFHGGISVKKMPTLQSVMDEVGITKIPKVNVAVLVGTALDPSSTKRFSQLPGINVKTLWGEMAAQLAISANNPELFDIIKESDKKSVSPGSEKLKNLFDACGPCLILMDELVAYARKLYKQDNLPAGTFGNFNTFIQEITEAATQSKNSLVVASIPESEIELGGPGGQEALEVIQNTFARKESIWKPVTANEGYEIVRRRLFQKCEKEDERDEICRQFSQMYRTNAGDFPIEAKEVDYLNKMIACFPIHPEIFDRLYEDWAILPGFQRTRGVLRLMAGVIHYLWMSRDPSPMIMPSSLPLENSNVRNELTKYLADGWNGIVDKEVDGEASIPFKKDRYNVRYGEHKACCRVARTIFMGSAPVGSSSRVRGLNEAQIRLGTIEPGDIIPLFNDALRELGNSLSYLYSTQDRYWFDTRPTLRKTVEERASRISDSEVEMEIEKRLSRSGTNSKFAGVHICPNSSNDVPDEQKVRLVILGVKDVYSSLGNSPAIVAAEDILSNRGNSPRIYKNMLVFVAADKIGMSNLKTSTKTYLAWKSIENDADQLNLDHSQLKETKRNIDDNSKVVDITLKSTYSWLLIPTTDRENLQNGIELVGAKLSGSEDSIAIKAAKRMISEETLIDRFGPALLLMELDSLLWRDKEYIEIKSIWDCFCKYCYLPRLRDFQVLLNCVKEGLNSDEYFGIAVKKADGNYIDVKLNCSLLDIDTSKVLIRPDLVKKLIEEKKEKEQQKESTNKKSDSSSNSNNSEGNREYTNNGKEQDKKDPSNDLPLEKLKTRFFMSAELDNTRIVRDVQKLVEEVIRHLEADGSVRISLEVEAENITGFKPDTINTVTENANSLKVKTHNFEEE